MSYIHDEDESPETAPVELPQLEQKRLNIIRPRDTFRDPADIPRRDWLYGKHYLRGAVSITVADSGVGKSNLAIAEAISMATGKPLLGVKPQSGLIVLYINLEEPADEIERRIHATCQHYGLDAKDLEGVLFFHSGLDEPLCIASMDRGKVVIHEPFPEMFPGEYDVVILDPFIKTHAVGENDNRAIDMVAQALARAAMRMEVAVELVHHARKTQSGSTVTVDDGRGASSFKAAARSVRSLNVMTDAEAARANVERQGRYFRAGDGKANYAELGDAEWYQLIPVDLPNGDNVATVARWQMPGTMDGVTTSDTHRVRTLAASGEYRSDPQSPAWIGNAAADALGLDISNENDRDKIKKVLKVWISNGVLKVEIRKDDKRKDRSFVVPGDLSE